MVSGSVGRICGKGGVEGFGIEEGVKTGDVCEMFINRMNSLSCFRVVLT